MPKKKTAVEIMEDINHLLKDIPHVYDDDNPGFYLDVLCYDEDEDRIYFKCACE